MRGAAAVGVAAWRGRPTRSVLAPTLGVAGLLAYNWWILVPLRPGLMRSPDELFSNIEVTGQPFASAMQRADLVAGLLIAAAFLVAGSRSIAAARREWLAMMIFGAAGAAGGLFPEVCADEISASCKRMELHFQLPVSQYVHIAAGIAEFAGITVAVLLAARRTRGDQTRTSRVYQNLVVGAYVGYPMLGAAYLLDRLGGVMEAVFFAGFTVLVVTQLAERAGFLRGTRQQRSAVDVRVLPDRGHRTDRRIVKYHSGGDGEVGADADELARGEHAPAAFPVEFFRCDDDRGHRMQVRRVNDGRRAPHVQARRRGRPGSRACQDAVPGGPLDDMQCVHLRIAQCPEVAGSGENDVQ